MFETKKLSREIIEQRRKERKLVKRANRKIIKKSCCKECGQPKHYVCLEHNPYRRKSFFNKLIKKRRYYARKIYFSVAKKLKFID